ncbi:rhamnogalacturonan acetylesterase [Glycomyces buryatensis]|uniref:Rhamnogalacturonan acetylesterase n=1 Tax=Glycomyces buryatensis TaxID=2570927 RepID=A0A4S8QNC8_9ACTN|nr:rhamnogalacturonan acetylesterase [Glycomyces buryatensis]THV42949.1 rhamnogalacturonan acetylesterase [Glycomyces buryatensis]
MTPPLSRRKLLAMGSVAVGSAAITAAIANADPRGATASSGGRIFIVGDSTAAIYPTSAAPRAGWGQALPAFVADGIEIVDRAQPGASSKSYADAGLLDAALREIDEGDWMLISFGHNDQRINVPDRYAAPYSTYQRYLTGYIERSRARGAFPVLLTSVERRSFWGGRARPTLGEYPEAMLALAEETGTAVIDLHALSLARWEQLGEEATKSRFMWVPPGHPNYPAGIADDTHFQARGAIEVARMVARAAADQGILPAAYWGDLDREVTEEEIEWPEELPDLL